MRAPSLLALLIAFLVGGYLSWQYFSRPKGTEDYSVLLESIETVTKLSTVEGTFSEIYTYSVNQEGYFSYFLGKKVLVRVRATVSAGYNLENLNLKADPLTKTIYMNGLPKPEILNIDHTLDYYDIQRGIFANFSKEDYNLINQGAKDHIGEIALKSNLLASADEQGAKMLDLIRFMVEGAGWHLQVGSEEGIRELRE